MRRRYYSSRKQVKQLSVAELYERFKQVYLYFQEKDYFYKAGIRGSTVSAQLMREAAFSMGFQPFPIADWNNGDVAEDRIFDVVEFMYDRVAQPGSLTDITVAGWTEPGYTEFNTKRGRSEFRTQCNGFLCEYGSGFELTARGEIRAMGKHGLEHILDAVIPAYDEKNVDSMVRAAIDRWRNRRLDVTERREAVRMLVDVFEWLRKSGKLELAMSRKDEAALFNIANNFAIRHHNDKQHADYDQDIWHSWMFHFYLATYHAVIRTLNRTEARK